MTAIVATQAGGPDVLRAETVAVPAPGQGEVLIEVHAAGVNRPDLMQREGRYPPPPGASAILGLEVAGRVVRCGPGVEPTLAGQRVCALVVGGGYAEYCLSPAVQCLPVPDRLTFVDAAALPEACFTVWANAFESGELRAGETLLVHGGASGIGTTAIQMARAFGARVFTTAGDDARCGRCVELGAELAINHRSEDFVAAVLKHTEGRGVDVILDMVGGDYTQRNLDALAPRGRLVQIAVQAGAKVSVNLLALMQKRAVLTGSTLRPRTVAEKGRLRDVLASVVWPQVARGALCPVIDSVFLFPDAANAHRRMESGEHVGKIVLRMRSE